MPHPSIAWTDETGDAVLVCAGLTFMNWTPDVSDVGESVVALGAGRTYFFAYRQDLIASFEVANIANTELALAMRLKSWLTRGGSVTINTEDSESRVYTSYVAPGTIPELTMTDTTELEYTLKLVVVNNAAEHMIYTPYVEQRPSGLSLSPSPLTELFPGSAQTVTATLTDALGNPIAGQVVTASSGDPGAFTVSPSSGTTDGSGHVAFSVTPVADGTGALTVRAGSLSVEDTVTVKTVDLACSPSPVALTVGSSDVDVTVTVTDHTSGLAVAGITIGGVSGNTGKYTVSPSSGVSDGSGHVVFTLHPVAAGSANFTASAGSTTHTDSVTVSASVYGILTPAPFLWLDRDTLAATLADTDPVSVWPDSSANAWDVTPENGGLFPVWDESVLGGSVKFDGTNDNGLRNASFNSLDPSSGFTLFVVAALTSGGLLSGHSSGATDAMAFGYLSSGFKWLPTGDPNNLYARITPFTDPAPHLFSLVFDGAGSGNTGRCKMYLDGVLQTLDFWQTIPASISGMTDIIVGRIYGGAWTTGHIAEVLGFPSALGSTDLSSAHTGILAKYGL